MYILGGSRPILRRNAIHFAMEVGVLFQKGGGGTLEDNEITGCGLDGVEVQAGSDPVLRRNVIRDSRKHGVLFDETARGTLEDNEITGSQLCGVKLEAGSDPVLRRNVIRDSQQNAVLFARPPAALWRTTRSSAPNSTAWKCRPEATRCCGAT